MIIKEIARPQPRFTARELGFLPNKTLPEVDKAFANFFATNDDFENSWNLASLVARYATPAILPQILETLDPRIGKLACAIQNPLLA